jgi:hypothetical protein
MADVVNPTTPAAGGGAGTPSAPAAPAASKTQSTTTPGGTGDASAPGPQEYSSFDELEDAHAKPRHNSDEETTDEDVVEGDPESDEVDPAEDGDAQEGEDTDADKKALEEKAKAKAEAKAADKKPIKVKTADGKTFDIAPDAVIEVPVDGKPQSVSLAELKKNYSGKVAYEQKFEELAKERKTYEADVQATDEALEHMVTLMKDGKPVAAVRYLAEILGADPRAIEKQITEAAGETWEKRSKMSPEERRAADAEEEAQYLRDREKQRGEREKATKDRSVVEGRVNTVLEKTGMDKKTFAAMAEEMRELGAKPEQITPEAVGEFYRAVQHEEGAKKVLDSVAPKLDNKDKAVTHLRTVWDQNPDFTEADITEIAQQVYGKKDAKALSRRIQKDAKVGGNANPASPKRSAKKDEPMFFDDI